MSVNLAIFLAAIFYGLFNYFMKRASGKISDELGSLILEGTAVLLIFVYMIFLRMNGWQVKVTSEGVLFSVLAGAFVAVSTILYFVVFRSGGGLATAGPMILLGGTLMMVLIGLVLLREKITVMNWMGLLLGVISLYLLKSSR